jgi:hypothetical protein
MSCDHSIMAAVKRVFAAVASILAAILVGTGTHAAATLDMM